MNSRPSLHVIDHSLERLRPSVAAAGWSTNAVDEARRVLLAVIAQSSYQSASPAIQSKAEILLDWRYLEYWYFEGAPLSVQIALWVGMETGLLHPPSSGIKRINEFVAFFPRQLAFEAAKRRAEIVGGWIFPGEAELFWDSIESTTLVAGDVAEIGSWVGRSSIVLAAGLETLSPTKRLHVVDDWCFGGQPNLYPYLSDKRILRAEFEENTASWSERIVIHEGLFQDVSGEMARASEAGFSLIFHDAGHTPADFERDLPLIAPLLNPGGCLLIHDYVSKHFGESRATIDAWVASHPHISLDTTVGTCAVIKRRS